MYLVYSGKMRVLHQANGEEVPLTTLYPGEHFGELAFVSAQPRNASVRTESLHELLTANTELRAYFDSYAEPSRTVEFH